MPKKKRSTRPPLLEWGAIPVSPPLLPGAPSICYLPPPPKRTPLWFRISFPFLAVGVFGLGIYCGLRAFDIAIRPGSGKQWRHRAPPAVFGGSDQAPPAQRHQLSTPIPVSPQPVPDGWEKDQPQLEDY